MLVKIDTCKLFQNVNALVMVEEVSEQIHDFADVDEVLHLESTNEFTGEALMEDAVEKLGSADAGVYAAGCRGNFVILERKPFGIIVS